ncbi:MAG TPA: DUF721 domain-containing protein [Flavobacteriaceae bacterium]|nr:DUF721 domain-containing protein [Flavobacteriaceae bacterium]
MSKNHKEDHQTMREALQQFVQKNRLQGGLDEINIQEVWRSEMGPGIQKYTLAVKLERETLYVKLSNSVLREELSYGKAKIIKMLNQAMQKELIKKLVLR